MQKGIQVHVQFGGDTFTLHRTQFDGGMIDCHTMRGNHGYQIDSGSMSSGYAATNENGNGPYHWVFVPESVVGGLRWSVSPSTKEISFDDVVVLREYFK